MSIFPVIFTAKKTFKKSVQSLHQFKSFQLENAKQTTAFGVHCNPMQPPPNHFFEFQLYTKKFSLIHFHRTAFASLQRFDLFTDRDPPLGNESDVKVTSTTPCRLDTRISLHFAPSSGFNSLDIMCLLKGKIPERESNCIPPKKNC